MGRAAAGCVAIVLGATGWFFASTGWLGYFDGWLVAALLLTTFARDRRTIWLMCLLAPWVDERFIIALPLALYTRSWRGQINADDGHGAGAGVDRRLLIGAAAISGSFIVVRLCLGAGSSSMGFMEYLRNQQTLQIGLGRHALGLAAGLRFGWVLLLAALVVAWRRSTARVAIGLTVGVIATVLVSMLIANDLSRSTSVLLPLALAGALEAVRHGWFSRRAGIGLALVALAVPAWHVVTDFSLRIERLPTVLQSFRHPAGSLAPLNWVKTAEQLVGRGESAAAERHIDIALRLDPACGAAYNVRGFIAYQRADWENARANFSTASRLTPADASHWLHYAYAAWKLQDVTTYRRAIVEAKRLAPEGSEVGKKIAALEALVVRGQ
ncbi:MAG: hypothetical protein ABIQ12_03295, partial [Opitutaceae bacterium]